MKRLGMYTGRIYTEDDFASNNIHECCEMITDEQAKYDGFVNVLFAIIHDRCAFCVGCPESQK